MHWADVIASKLGESGREHRIATGITPSGPIHIGNMREILTGDIVHRACRDAGLGSELFYLADDFDPLRKVYPFLPPEFEEHVGKPLSEIPPPDGGGGPYSEYFLEPFLGNLDRLGIEPTVLRSSDSYASGRYADVIGKLMDSRLSVNRILSSVSGRQLEEDHIPYTPKCSECGRLTTTKPLSWERPFVYYECSCGHKGASDIRKADGKLPWRLDWPARWSWLGVTVEPFGKDHAASGGSYDSGSRIIREVLDGHPPFPIVYEWIQLKGKGAMHSSTGLVVTGSDMLRMAPPEVLRFYIARPQPSRHLDFDPGLGLISLIDEFDRYEAEFLRSDGTSGPDDDMSRIYNLSMVDPSQIPRLSHPRIKVPYRHLVTLVQLTDEEDLLKEKICRSEGLTSIDEASFEEILGRVECVKFWLDKFAPRDVKFHLLDKPSEDSLRYLDDEMWNSLAILIREMPSIEWDPESIHNGIYEISRSNNIEPGKSFKALYRVLLGSERGPRLGFFLANLDKDKVMTMIEGSISIGQLER
ncbi:MAG: lysine--tRNA ligase [Candidatus Thermoplasmatota archaeon]|nr:lysine--tRNA ligase [Candidatus Thermoplasmatota archaeon]